MNNINPKKAVFSALGLVFSVVPVLSLILLYFPIWTARGDGAVLSGFTLLLILLAFAPLFRALKSILKSPSAHTMWFIIFIIFFMLSKIADEMTVISFVGFISNMIGSLFFRAARRVDRRQNYEGQV